ncbi:CHAT domain-containing protein [bacterium]|nr:CHAT domain-containing protein [bacterium]
MSHLLFDEAWDILFFAGHSFSDGESGRIQINRHMSLPLHALRQSLARAVANGLKLAIFNSCDGLGIADFLTELRVPAIVVMREPVPDRIACKFLLYFLKEFSQGTPLCLAVRRARDRLESIQSSFPAASWLPVVCLNPIQPELVWPPSTRQPRTSSVWRFSFSNRFGGFNWNCCDRYLLFGWALSDFSLQFVLAIVRWKKFISRGGKICCR